MTSPSEGLREKMAGDREAMTPTSITHLRELLAKATPRPYRNLGRAICTTDSALVEGRQFAGFKDPEDADLYFALVNAAPRLLDMAEALNAYDAAYDWIGADSFDGIDPRGRELLELAHSMSRIARAALKETSDE